MPVEASLKTFKLKMVKNNIILSIEIKIKLMIKILELFQSSQHSRININSLWIKIKRIILKTLKERLIVFLKCWLNKMDLLQ
jgi:hypothetical protein